MVRCIHYLLPVLTLFLTGTLIAQPTFDTDAYRQFLQQHTDISADQLRALYPAGEFQSRMATDFAHALYGDSIDHHYNLTVSEKDLINRHGFMVTERLTRGSFGESFLEIYKKDLPVFVSSDAILHALHMSYDAMLMDIEAMVLIPKLDSLLATLHGQLPTLVARYASEPRMQTMLRDFDVYLTVPRILLDTNQVTPFFPENKKTVDELLELIKGEQAGTYNLFADRCRRIDFSQFTPRGHYTRDPALTRYFQAMMWLGRTEIYLIAPKSDDACVPSESDVQRQIILSVLVHEAAKEAGAYELLGDIDRTIGALVGESDNVTLPNVYNVMWESQVIHASDLLDMKKVEQFQTTLATKPYAGQRILSQILMSDPMSPDQLAPASAFLLLGQRFIIDSYVTANVVYDRVMAGGAKAKRMLPSALDVLFALGNDAAAHLLRPELDRYQYGSNLAALRYLVDSYEPDFWNGTVYNGWLNAIRALNPPADRAGLPSYMRTAAWWQQKMNGQLASWAQLRHDNLLYAKQSYSGGISCVFPKSLVEPVPEFYRAIGAFAENAIEKFGSIPVNDPEQREGILEHFRVMRAVADTLETIATKELAEEDLSSAEIRFLKGMMFEKGAGCTTVPDGWYPNLFYASRVFYTDSEPEMIEDKVVVDVHTAPTDENGAMVGWVVHAGTGPLNLMVVVCSHGDGESTAYIGPVMSYYEHVSTNFKRLTDEEWKTAYNEAPSARPDWVWLYLADKSGVGHESGAPSLITSGVDDEVMVPSTGAAPVLSANVPNPFSGTTTISFSIPRELSGETGQLAVFTATGERVKVLVERELPVGSYSARWDGTDESGRPIADGAYLYALTIGGKTVSGKMTLVRGGR